ncbi:hypothetical protein OYC64_012977 [Pagothenia borchgrevinki]|uniref:Uncharacterized protein n=1 Tax=Pagothenia borchgrevinki TaxID=8213 RepID=A0ABD2FT73_PAGBO
MHSSHHDSTTAIASSTAYHPTSSINSNISRTLLPASSPTPAPETTSLPSSRTSTGSPSVKQSTSKSSSLLTKPSTTSPPPYLTDLLHHHTPSRCLRSSEANLLSIPTRINHRTWGDRAFSVAAPSVWNSLPQPIRDCTDLTTFKKLTKTHLFNMAFNV